MAQILSSSNKLTSEQVEVCVHNFAKVRHFRSVELIFEGKPMFNQKSRDELTKLGLEPFQITKFADNYKIYMFKDVCETDSMKLIKKYNPTAQFKNTNDRVEIAIVVDSDKIDKQNYLALQALYPMIHPYLLQNTGYNMMGGEDEKERPAYIQYYRYIQGPCFVTIFTTNHIEPAMLKHFHTRFIPCNYRVMSLYDDVYPLLGSRSRLWCGYTSNFEVIEHEDLYNGYNYSVIYDHEHLVKIMNANPGDLIVGTQIINEGRPYMEIVVKEVKTKANDGDDENTS